MKSICDIDVWGIIIPEESSNKVLNPSGETTGNFSNWLVGATVTRVTTYQWRGLYCYRVQVTVSARGAQFTLSPLANAVNYVSLRARGLLPISVGAVWEWSLDSVTWHRPKLLGTDNGWSFYGMAFPASEASGSTTLILRQLGAGTTDWYIVAVQVEEMPYWTTYIDGDQPGCAWNGTAHASTSTRSSQSRAGGRIRKISSYYDLALGAWQGTGFLPITYNSAGQALLPGEVTQNYKLQPRSMIFSLEVPAVEPKEVQKRLGPFMRAVSPNLVSPRQPFRLRYAGGAKELEIACDYDTGFESGFEWRTTTKVPLRVIARDDPFFYEVPESATSLQTQQNIANANSIVNRINGEWSALGTGITGGGSVHALAYGPDGTLYVGGSFLNQGDANGDYIVKWNGVNWVSLGSGVNDVVNAIVVAANGDVYVGGEFSAAGGVANTRGIAKWDGANWNAVGTGIGNAGEYVRALLIDAHGILYATGNFADAFNPGMGGVVNTNRIAYWDGSNWYAMDVGLDDGQGNALAVRFGWIYVGGTFTAASGVTNTGYVARWTGSQWLPLSTVSLGNTVNALAFISSGVLYIGGDFTNVGGDANADYIVKWTGAAYRALSTGVNDTVFALRAQGTRLYVGGIFTISGDLTAASRIALWDRTHWEQIDITLPATPNVDVYAISTFVLPPEEAPISAEAEYIGPLVTNRLVLGYDTAGTATTSNAGSNTVHNAGSADAYPIFILKRTGGTSARLVYLKNETTNQLCLFDYSLQSGEVLTVDFRQDRKFIQSSINGNVLNDTLLVGSDFAAWKLQPGDNSISLLVYDSGGPTLDAHMLFQPAHLGVETAL